ncbi:hypothetical protein [Aquimarina sp. SS2-1]|uniref:hypothetical protein n=1 Tax=Aquimarina besae TaxID=3342247 RepID=UPI00366B105B
MKILKKIFSASVSPKYIFPKETSDGKIEMLDNRIICTGDYGIHSCEVNINNLQYAYIVINRNKESLLFLFDFHQNYLPTNYSGFKQIYNSLSDKLGFDDQTFFNNVYKKEETKKEIWRKLHPSNFKILQEQYADYGLGFEILSPEKDFIYWDTTYDELRRNPNVSIEESPYRQKILKFTYPVRIGNLVLKDFGYYVDTSRTDVPVLHFYTHCIDSSNSDKSYYKIKKRFIKDFKPDHQIPGYERDDQNSISFKVNDILFSLVYTYDSDWQFNGGYTSFSVRNQREYTDLLIDRSYESIIEISSYLEFSDRVRTSGDYKRNNRVKRRPSILESKKPMIWIDDRNSRIGFADQSYSQTFKKDTIKQFTIQNILPAKGAGGAYLEINFKDNSKIYSVLNGACSVFDAYKERIEKLTGLEVKIAPEYHDC